MFPYKSKAFEFYPTNSSTLLLAMALEGGKSHILQQVVDLKVGWKIRVLFVCLVSWNPLLLLKYTRDNVPPISIAP